VIRDESGPSEATVVFALAPGVGSPYPNNTVAIQDLNPIWPEPVSVNPRMNSGIIEDSEVREAVKSMSAFFEAERRRGWMGRLPIPHLSLTRPDMKWLVMSFR
jgi:hypothetical protein